MEPTNTCGEGGVTTIEVKVADVTVKAAFPLTPSRLAEIVAPPALTPLANPGVSSPAVWTVATPVLEELQVAILVISRVVESE